MEVVNWKITSPLLNKVENLPGKVTWLFSEVTGLNRDKMSAGYPPDDTHTRISDATAHKIYGMVSSWDSEIDLSSIRLMASKNAALKHIPIMAAMIVSTNVSDK